MKKIIVCLMLCTAVILFACGKAEQMEANSKIPEFVLTYAENQAEDYPTTQGAYKFAELVKKRSGGRIEIMVNAGGSLGDERSVIEQLQFGGIDFARVSLSVLADQVPKLNVLQMPYLYTGSDHMWKVLEGKLGDDFLKSVEDIDLMGLSWYDAGARNFYSSQKPITKLEDMKGMVIRVQESELMMAMVEALGAKSTAMVYSDVYSALQTGTIGGAENNWPSYDSASHYEVAKYFTLDEHTRVPELQLASEVTWNRLSPEDQAIIKECAMESARYERELWREREKASEAKVRAAGCQVIELPSEEKARFQEAVTPVYEKFCSDYMDIIDAIVAAGK